MVTAFAILAMFVFTFVLDFYRIDNICICVELVLIYVSEFIDGMTQVIQRLESHARTDRPIKALRKSLEGNSDQFTQDMILVKICFKRLSEIYTIACNH